MRIINAARGGLVDEQALADAIAEGRVAGAGIDVFAKEPCTESPLFAHENVVVTPHLGASTVEAQDKAGLAVAKSVKLALQGEFVPDAVNVQAGGVVAEDVRPGLPLAEKLGRVFTAVAGGVAQSITVEVRGEIVEHDVSVLQLAALKGVFADIVEESVTFVNAPLLAKERGVEVGLTTSPDSPDYRNLVTVRGVLADGRTVSVSGTLTGPQPACSGSSSIDGFDIDLAPDGHLLFFRYDDRPGIVGTLGRMLGDAERQHRRHAGGPDRRRRRRADGAVRRPGRAGRPARGDRRGDRRHGRQRGGPHRGLIPPDDHWRHRRGPAVTMSPSLLSAGRGPAVERPWAGAGRPWSRQLWSRPAADRPCRRVFIPWDARTGTWERRARLRGHLT